MNSTRVFLFAVSISLCSCAHKGVLGNVKRALSATVYSHQEFKVPGSLAAFPVGGISGLDYDADQNKYIAISDDKGEYGPPRAYRFGLSNTDEIVEFEEIILAESSSPNGGGTIDAESVRFLSSTSIVWSSEEGKVFVTNLNKLSTNEFKLPPHVLLSEHETIGARNNKFIEGVSFLRGKEKIVFALETSLKQDGPVATKDKGALSRILVFDFATQVLLDEYLYPLDPIPVESEAVPPWSDNGVSEVLAIDDSRLLVLERSGRHIGNMDFSYSVRCYLVSIDRAGLAQTTSSGSEAISILEKELVFEMDDLIDPEENYESLSFGQPLASPSDKNALLVYLMNDSNFNANRNTYLTKLLISLP